MSPVRQQPQDLPVFTEAECSIPKDKSPPLGSFLKLTNQHIILVLYSLRSIYFYSSSNIETFKRSIPFILGC